MPAKSPEALKRKYLRGRERYKERWANDPEFRKRENKRHYEAKKRRIESNFVGPKPMKASKHEHYKWFIGLKKGAEKRGIPFNLEVDDLYIPDKCPVLGIPLFKGKGVPTPNSPTIDRIDNLKGYSKDNIWVISARANTLKSNASLKEIEMLYLALSKKIKNS